MLRHNRCDDLQIGVGPLGSDSLDNLGAVLLEVLMQRGDEILAKLVARTLGPAFQVAGLPLREWTAEGTRLLFLPVLSASDSNAIVGSLMMKA